MMDATSDLDRVRDYLVGRLSDDDRRSFEERLARDPELVREFEQALELREGLQELQSQGYFIKPLARPAAGARRLIGTWLPLLTAAAITAVAFIVWTQRSAAPPGLLSASPAPAASVADAPAVRAQFTFIPTRGSTTPDLNLPSSGLIEFRAAPGMHGTASRYRMTLVRRDEAGPSRSVGTLAQLTPGGDGYLHGYADAARLSPGSYLLRVDSGTAGAVESEEFEFNLRAAGGH
jgi:hypothetical protein